MSTSPRIVDSPRGAAPPKPVAWRSWTLRDEGPGGWVLVLAGVAMALVVGVATGQAMWGLIALFAMWASCWRLFIPGWYELGPDGVYCRVAGRTRLLGWHTIARYEVHPRGMLLFPRDDRRAPARLSGFYVPWGQHRDEVIDAMTHYLGHTQRAGVAAGDGSGVG